MQNTVEPILELAEKLTLKNEDGLHARPAGVLAKKAMEFKSTIELRGNGQTKNAKSIMSVMAMGLKKGDEIEILAKGEDASVAIDSLKQLLEQL